MGNRVVVRAVNDEDVRRIAAGMRAADAREVARAGARDPLSAVAESVAASTLCWVAEVDGELCAVFGVAPINGMLSASGAPWMLGTDALDRHSVSLMRTCRPYIAQMRSLYPHLLNYVDAENVRSVRWLRRLGFEIHPAVPFGVGGEPFHMFEMG